MEEKSKPEIEHERVFCTAKTEQQHRLSKLKDQGVLLV